jgi:YfiR/HmsC-like
MKQSTGMADARQRRFALGLVSKGLTLSASRQYPREKDEMAAPIANRRVRSLALATKAWASFSFLLGLALVCPGSAQTSDEYKLKADLLLNLARFVDWPPSAFDKPDAPLTIGILGYDPFGLALDEDARGERISGHPVRVERYRDLRQAMASQILFISASERRHLCRDVAATRKRPILTVGEQADFLKKGGIVRFHVNAKGNVRLQIDPAAAKAHGLVISSKLLRVADIDQPP